MASGRICTLLLVTCLVSASATLPDQGAAHSASRKLTQTKPVKPADVKLGDSVSTHFKRIGKQYSNPRHLLTAATDVVEVVTTRQLAQTTQKPIKPTELKLGDSASAVFKRIGKQYGAGRRLLTAAADPVLHASTRQLAQTTQKPIKPTELKLGDSASAVFKRIGKQYGAGR